MKRQFLLLALLALVSISVQAYDFTVDGIYYNIIDNNGKIVEVTKGDAKYSGSVSIPATVSYSDQTYSVGKVGDCAFQSCTDLESVILGSNVEYVNYKSFDGCTNLSSINLNDQIKSFGTCAFLDCTSLTSVIIGSSVDEMGGDVFNGCINLNTVDIHEGASVIGQSAFYGCKKLSTITIPNSVLTIGASAFNNCISLTEAKIGNGVKTIPDNVFQGCTNLESVSLGTKVENINYKSFDGCTNLSSINLNDQIKSFGTCAFLDCTSLTSVIIGSSVDEMGGDVFNGCINLNTVDIHEGASVIGQSAFYGCKKLSTITIPNSVLTIGASAFNNCISLTEAKIGNGVQVIPDNIFQGCTRLSTVSLGSIVKKVGYKAFDGCNSMSSFTINNTNTPEVESTSFSDYGATLYVPSQSISAYKAHEVWKIFYDIKEIGSSAVIDNITFTDPEVKKICVANWDSNGDGELSKDEAAMVTSLGTAFNGNLLITNFNELKYFTGLSKIDDSAFSGCTSLTSVTIPNSVTSIGDNAFENCTSLTDFYSLTEEVPLTAATAFDGSDTDKNATLHVPEAQKDTYMTTTPWSEFKVIAALEDDEDAITIKDTGKGTYCSEYDLDFTNVEGIKAYVAIGYDDITKTIWLARIYAVPAGTGIMVKGDPGKYKIPHETVKSVYANYFKGNLGSTVTINATDGDMTNYYMKNGQFVSVNGTANIAANRCYLQLPTSVFAGTRSIGIVYDDEEEGTTSIYNSQFKINSFDQWFDMQGRRVSKPTKPGLYIKNGKKVVIKD